MKKTYTFLTLILLTITSFIIAQESVSMKPGYAEDVYYSFADGEVATASSNDWDLAFQISGFAASIRINSIKGVELKTVPGLGIEDWALVDTADIANWEQVYNSDQVWETGAFNAGLDIANPFDLGWGTYNQTTHIVSGDSLFVITLADESIKKIKVDQLSGGVYSFTYADIDGSNEVNATLNKVDFENKFFGYYSFENNNTINREPDQGSWDIVFTRYTTDLAPGVKYGVTGVLSNPAVEVAEVRGVNLSEISLADTTNADFTTMISTIGYDWKDFVMTPIPGWVLADSLGYFVRAQNGETYLLYFMDFGGSQTGDVSFEVSNLTTSLEVPETFSSFNLFPNPSNGTVNISYELVNPESVKIEIMDLSGRSLFRANRAAAFGLQALRIESLQLPKGAYLVNLTTSNSRITEKLIIN